MTTSILPQQRTQVRLKQAALHYAEYFQWAVFPIHSLVNGRCTCGKECGRAAGKHPLTRNGFKDATNNKAILSRWWERWPWANIGIATGRTSGFFVLDVDGDKGEDSLRTLLKEHGKLPDTVESLTGGGGRHILFQHPGTDIRNVVRLAPGLDIRGDGGYIVAPPSVHRSGRQYEWELSSRPDEVGISPAPSWLLEILQQDRAVDPATPANEWRALAQGVPKVAATMRSPVARAPLWTLREPPLPCNLYLLGITRTASRHSQTPKLSRPLTAWRRWSFDADKEGTAWPLTRFTLIGWNNSK